MTEKKPPILPVGIEAICDPMPKALLDNAQDLLWQFEPAFLTPELLEEALERMKKILTRGFHD